MIISYVQLEDKSSYIYQMLYVQSWEMLVFISTFSCIFLIFKKILFKNV